jgi:hypothetical protein
MRPEMFPLYLLVAAAVVACAHSADDPVPSHPAEGAMGGGTVSLCSDSADAFRRVVREFRLSASPASPRRLQGWRY